MNAPLISTCVGGRRAAGVSQHQPAALPRRYPKPVLLTKREMQSVRAVIETGFCTLAAAQLGISVKTIEIHMRNARDKYGVSSNYQLIAAFVRGEEPGGSE